MGDRWYRQQKEGTRPAPNGTKKPRVLKKDIIAEINTILGREVDGLDKCTIATLTTLKRAINDKL